MFPVRPLLIALTLFFLPNPLQAQNQIVAGRATIIDGDTILLSGVDRHIRLFGIDAPERDQFCTDRHNEAYACGRAAADQLRTLIPANRPIRCQIRTIDHYGRFVGECHNVAGDNINAAMVASGWAMEYRRYSEGRYTPQARLARQQRRGLWAGSFTRPSKWRCLNAPRAPGAPPRHCR